MSAASRERPSSLLMPTDVVNAATPNGRAANFETPPDKQHPHTFHPVADSCVPKSGETFAGFKLLRELGRGGFGRVYLAEQADLARRPVALKIVPAQPTEVRTLARLQHTNIVPVHSVHRDGMFSAICMPFFGGTTLASVLSDLLFGERPRSGQAILDAIRRRQATPPRDEPEPADIALLKSATYVDAVLWIGERLADALDHAHQRGIVHRDIKPANVLMADDGRPMLLDFNMAEDDNEDGRLTVGGTLPYMSPEQITAFAGGPRTLDARTDVYALGALMYQLLARRMAYPDHVGSTKSSLPKIRAERDGPPPLVRPHNPDVSPAVESIVRTCLQSDPTRRYPSAAAVLEDLRRQRSNRPLAFAPEPSWRERATKWKRRHPRLASPGAALTLAGFFLLVASAVGVQLSLSARARQQDADRLEATRQFEEFLVDSDRIKLAAGTPGGSGDVLALSETTLAKYDVGAADWQERDAVRRLSAVDRERLVNEVGELAYLTGRASAVTKKKPEEVERWNGVAERLLGGSPSTGDGGRGDFLKACDLAARGQYRAALPAIDRFVAKQPEDFGGWFLKAKCHDGLGQYEEARAAYGTCAALRPKSAMAIAARGELTFRHGHDRQQALADLDRALTLEPERHDARLNRALVLRSLGRFDLALADLDFLLDRGRTPTRIRFVRAEVREAKGDKAGAAADRQAGMASEPTDAAGYVTRGLARAAKDPEGALKDFQAAEKLEPHDADALVNQAWLLGDEMHRLPEAVKAVDRLLEMYPDHQNGRTGRAVLYARMGQTDKAIAEARECLAGAPHASAYYQAGCVFALVAKENPGHRDEALRLLSTALLRGFGHDFLPTDSDLAPLRGDERFQKLLDGVKTMKRLGEAK